MIQRVVEDEVALLGFFFFLREWDAEDDAIGVIPVTRILDLG